MKIFTSIIGLTTLMASTFAIADTMTIILSGKYILSTDTRIINIKDLNCNKDLGSFSLSGNQNIPITICKNDSGYGNIQYRNVTLNGPWTKSSLLSENDEVSP